MDYDNFIKEDLIVLLKQKDVAIENYKEGGQGIVTSDMVIQAIVRLSEKERELLPSKIRTTEIGIRAYGIFIHGATSCLNVDDGSRNIPPVPVKVDTNPPTDNEGVPPQYT